MLQLVVRSKFREDDGGRVKGTFTPTPRRRYLPLTVRDQRNLFVQASDRWSPFQGCCHGNTHENVFNLSEKHFLDFHNGDWDLFFVREFKDSYRFILVPHRKLCVILDCRKWHNWTLLGTCQTLTLRIDLEELIQTSCNDSSRLDGGTDTSSPMIPQQQQPPDKPKHWHITVYMDSFNVHRNFPSLVTSVDSILQQKQQDRSVFKSDPHRPLVNFSHAGNYSRHPFWNFFHTSRGQDAHQAENRDVKESSGDNANDDLDTTAIKGGSIG